MSQRKDTSTSEVMEWLYHFGRNVKRVNVEDNEGLIIELGVGNHEPDLKVKTAYGQFQLEEVRSYWYRRGGVPRNFPNPDPTCFFKESLIVKKLFTHLKKEKEALAHALHFFLENNENMQAQLGTFFNQVSKLENLHHARSVGFKVPETLVSNDLERIRERCEKEPHITKGIREMIMVLTQKKDLVHFTEAVDKELLDGAPDTLFPSLIQKEIAKEYELRVTFIKGECYAMAIFSQNDDQTRTDFRKYNFESPNRFVPYTLPGTVQRRIKDFMEQVGMDFGSLDLIVDKDGEFYFLEINPVGQFGMVSESCNHPIEKRIAEILSVN